MSSKAELKTRTDQIREKAESDLAYFAHLVSPHRVYGDVHRELFGWWTRHTAKDCQLVLLPRDHGKSHAAAVRCAWELTKDPAATVLYVSATADLAEKQLYAVKLILTSEVYRKYWPEMTNPEEGKRARWTTTEIIVDHPIRSYEGVRDPSIKAAGLTTNITGFHASHVYLDDVVVPDNAYTEEGRRKVASLYSQLASIETTGAIEVVVGTRYHPDDLYNTLIEMKEDVFSEDLELVGQEHVYEVFVRVVEEDGVFLWPQSPRPSDGKPFGFNVQELARKRAKYVDRTQFYAQYYNDPNDPSMDRLDRTKFQYYDEKFLNCEGGQWSINGERLNLFAAIDFAYSMKKTADYTAIVVIGISPGNQIYVLEIDRFRTSKISEYYTHLFAMYSKWGFRKMRAEVTAAQSVIVKDIKDNYVIPNGLALSIDEYRPTRNLGSKEERVAAILETRYDNQVMWHYKGGMCNLLEEELILANPPHDDIKDALSQAVDIAVAPTMSRKKKDNKVVYHPRFGGVPSKRI